MKCHWKSVHGILLIKKKQLLLTLEDVIVDTSIKYYETVTEGLYSV